ncbi:UNVERIFIED_CONTAM: hypothetical protein Sangu_0644400 [Sesamum angustifolium]|uniref:Uncharacterized protein n=1 Tax=Sesamum angustifolium TaxID=2727405 RepID=A0AAW2QDU2_9LAMI
MGNCRSCDASRSTTETAKLVLRDGRLQEFSWPVKVSLVLQQNPDCFICSSDEMEFDQYVAEIGGDEELQPGRCILSCRCGGGSSGCRRRIWLRWLLKRV